MSLSRAHILNRQQEAFLAENTRLREVIRMACHEPSGLHGEPAFVPSRNAPHAAQVKTKMCKFHIMGQCAKGEKCLFAHSQEELNALPDLRCTKLCRTLLKTGRCDAIDCTYAHSKEELRQMGQTRLHTSTYVHVRPLDCKLPGNQQDVLNAEATPLKVTSQKTVASKADDLSPAYVILPTAQSRPTSVQHCEQPASWELPMPFLKIACPPAPENSTGISIDQSKGDLQIRETEFYTPFGSQSDIFRPLRSVRTSETTLCTLTDRS
jgi:hypothetical protein